MGGGFSVLIPCTRLRIAPSRMPTRSCPRTRRSPRGTSDHLGIRPFPPSCRSCPSRATTCGLELQVVGLGSRVLRPSRRRSPRSERIDAAGCGGQQRLPHHAVLSGRFNSALLGSLVSPGERERQEAEINDLLAGSAAAGPAPEDRLHQQHGLRECQAGRGRKGFSRSSVRNPCAAVTSAVWWCHPSQERPS
jgi:hypothetical protein